ncbi:MAG: manganese efflux pump MntP family protein [Clostridiales bacterium]|jgi:putative Mn2+ efflux pump MntP|nr:manganese efflux pump MntP family protein [Clostridiales bacterium]
MNLATLVLTSLALAMDAFAVSITIGMTILIVKPYNAIKTGLFFGIFQAVMPLIGWFTGNLFKEYIEKISNWIAFALLLFLGIKMILESVKHGGELKKEPTGTKNLLVLAVATSIDAFAVGIAFAAIGVSNICSSILLIGIITFILSFTGVYIGKKVGSLFKKRAGIIGGLVLIGIGIKILLY